MKQLSNLCDQMLLTFIEKILLFTLCVILPSKIPPPGSVFIFIWYISDFTFVFEVKSPTKPSRSPDF